MHLSLTHTRIGVCPQAWLPMKTGEADTFSPNTCLQVYQVWGTNPGAEPMTLVSSDEQNREEEKLETLGLASQFTDDVSQCLANVYQETAEMTANTFASDSEGSQCAEPLCHSHNVWTHAISVCCLWTRIFPKRSSEINPAAIRSD